MLQEEVMTMPLGDRTGPRGEGPLTGRLLGYCAGFALPGFLLNIRDRFGLGARRASLARSRWIPRVDWVLVGAIAAILAWWIRRTESSEETR